MIIDGAIGVRDAIAQFAALVDAAGGFGSAVAAYAARERKLFEEALHPRYVFAHVGINLGVRSLKIVLGQNSRRTADASGYKNGVNHGLVAHLLEWIARDGVRGVRPPRAQQSGFGVLWLERFSKQGVVFKVNHPQEKIEAVPPVGVDLLQLVGTERCA